MATIIKVGTSEAGIIGLKEALRDTYVSGIKEEDQLKAALLEKVKECGNYITPGTEISYKDALWREYRIYVRSTVTKANKP